MITLDPSVSYDETSSKSTKVLNSPIMSKRDGINFPIHSISTKSFQPNTNIPAFNDVCNRLKLSNQHALSRKKGKDKNDLDLATEVLPKTKRVIK